jgi:hypothetical protein
VTTILQYSDVYREPSRFIDALDDDIELESISDSLLGAFKGLKGQTTILTSALESSHGVKHKLEAEWMKTLTTGFCNSNTICSMCEKPLQTQSVYQSKFLSSFELEDHSTSLVVFRCGHNYHKYCLDADTR